MQGHWKTIRGQLPTAARAIVLWTLVLAVLAMTGVPAYAGAWIRWGQEELVWETSDDYELLLTHRKARTLEGALELALRLDRIADRLEDVMPDFPRTSSALGMWTLEVVPYYYYEGVVDRPVYPNIITWLVFEGERHFHVLGSAVPWYGVAMLNVRYINPASPWYEARFPIATLVHELAHINGINNMTDPLMEPTTQLVTLEVLAAMTNHGNRYTLLPFIEELRGFLLDYAYLKALQQGRTDYYMQITARMYDDPARGEAARDKSARYWAGREEAMVRMLELYGQMPYILLLEGLEAGESRDLPSLPNAAHRLVVDDAGYLLGHLRDLVQAELDREGQQ